ncbi:hypothetical protein BGZ63DRAFT_444865 [Mariannaea sp. PMI_226]|nr:hypothetical protein BGZ63DRAFT_444865 [Mariannaea sp. PMI_226]
MSNDRWLDKNNIRRRLYAQDMYVMGILESGRTVLAGREDVIYAKGGGYPRKVSSRCLQSLRGLISNIIEHLCAIRFTLLSRSPHYYSMICFISNSSTFSGRQVPPSSCRSFLNSVLPYHKPSTAAGSNAVLALSAGHAAMKHALPILLRIKFPVIGESDDTLVLLPFFRLPKSLHSNMREGRDLYFIANTVLKKVITTAITDFQNDLADLLVEWTVLNNWLAYRHMVSYWLGLVEWRNSVYNDQPYKPVLEAASPSSRLHHAKQFLLSSVRLLRPTDEGYFKLTCSSFRQVQREHQKVFCKAVEELERKYMAVAGKKRLARVRRRLEDRTGKFFPVTKEFDPDMPVGERNLVGDIEYGTAGRHRLGEILAHVGKEWRM